MLCISWNGYVRCSSIAHPSNIFDIWTAAREIVTSEFEVPDTHNNLPSIVPNPSKSKYLYIQHFASLLLRCCLVIVFEIGGGISFRACSIILLFRCCFVAVALLLLLLLFCRPECVSLLFRCCFASVSQPQRFDCVKTPGFSHVLFLFVLSNNSRHFR